MRPVEPASPPAVEARGLTRRFGSQVAVDRLDLRVPRGVVFGFLGPNGAGKSTVVRMLLGLLAPDEGEARLFGRPVDRPEAREGVGFLPEKFGYPGWMSGRELLEHHGRLLGLPPARVRSEAAQALHRVGLEEAAHRRIRTFSKGMQQRLGIAASLLGEPRLLVWDEPTSALDPLGRLLVRDLILEERRRGATVFLNSHLLGEVERVSDHVAVIHRGRILRQGALEELLQRRLRVVLEAEPLEPPLLEELGRIGSLLAQEGHRLELAVPDREALPALAGAVAEAGARLYRLEPRGETLEEFFVQALEEASR
ncbi:MAG: ABC transporter ATP-binding protein [Bacillota bacterium]|nr:ABC transporter ATP-binding protein [Bacillota bacterium]